MRKLVAASRATVLREIEEFGAEEVARRRFRAMAVDGNLALLGAMINITARNLSDVFLTAIQKPETDVVRGQIIGLRNLWRDILGAGEPPTQEPEPLHLGEMNPFEGLTEDQINPLEFSLTQDQEG